MSHQIAKRPKMDEGYSTTSPKETCNLSTQKFSEIVGLAAFVDKTLFIKAFLQAHDNPKVILAPSKFGKSTNMDMVKEFVTGNKKLFEDNKLKIWEEEREFFNEYCQENPVIHVGFQDVEVNDSIDFFGSLKRIIARAFNDHDYLVELVGDEYSWSDEKLNVIGSAQQYVCHWKVPENVGSVTKCELVVGLTFLSKCLDMYHEKRVYVFIDDYDSPLMNAIMLSCQGGFLDSAISLIGEMMYSLLNGNVHVKKALLNACVRVEKYDTGNFQYCDVLRTSEFSPYFGFTDKEVNNLFERDEFVTFKNNDVLKWYNGYRLLHTNEYVIYRSHSILEYLQKSREMNKPQFDTYWGDARSIPNLKEIFAKTEIRRLIENLIDGEEVEVKTSTTISRPDLLILSRWIHKRKTITTPSTHLFLQFITMHGYLNVVSTGAKTSALLAPNDEVKTLLKKMCYDVQFFQDKYQLPLRQIRLYADALDLLPKERDRGAVVRLARYVSKLFDPALMPKSVDDLHSCLFTLAYNVKTFVASSKLSVQRIKRGPHHHGLLAILGEVGMILVLKFETESSQEAHTQMLEYNAFAGYRGIKVKILLGVHMTTKKNTVSVTYTVGHSGKETVTSIDF